MLILQFFYPSFNIYEFAFVDVHKQVMSGVMNYLSLRIPPFVRVDLFQIVFTRCNRLSGGLHPTFSMFYCFLSILHHLLYEEQGLPAFYLNIPYVVSVTLGPWTLDYSHDWDVFNIRLLQERFE